MNAEKRMVWIRLQVFLVGKIKATQTNIAGCNQAFSPLQPEEDLVELRGDLHGS